jgi:putative heme-binding domain-containing protein
MMMPRSALARFVSGWMVTCWAGFVGVTPPAEGQEPRAIDIYRRSVLSERADAGRGRRLFDDARRTHCIGCHAVDGRGGRLGPDLMGVGGRLTRAEILEAVLEPSAKIHPDYTATVIATKAGQILSGIVRPVGENEIEVATSETQATRLTLDEIDERKSSDISFMPAGLHESLLPREMADLVAYLEGLALPKPLGSNEAVDPDEVPRARRPVAFRPIHGRDLAFRRPVWFGPLPGHRGTFAVVEIQSGKIWLLEGDEGSRRKALFADLADEITGGDITGVMGLAFHPDFARNRRYFLKLHGPRDGGRLPVLIVERKATEDGLRDSGQPSKLILKIPTASEIHNGGHLAFGPDGYLYSGMGDTGPQGDPQGHAQDLGLLLGKMLRIDIDRPDGDRPYGIPATNPFRDRAGVRPEIWAYGLREPWRFSFDSVTGDLWVGDVGQGRYEEVAIVRSGENHGWNILEGFRPHSERFRTPGAAYVAPVFAYSHGVGVSVTGGFVYRGSRQQALRGKYVFGDYETRRVWALEQKGGKLTSVVEIGRAPERIASFGTDEDGEIYVVGFDNGIIYRLDADGADLAAVETRELVPSSRRVAASWRYALRRPADEWVQPGFDDSSWTSAPGGFGSRGTPGATVRTEWLTADIWLRREVNLPPDVVPAALNLSIHHDEDAEVYLNGVLAARVSGFVNHYESVPIRDDARATIRAGRNVLAVHCHQTRGGQYIDVGIVETRSPTPPEAAASR